MEGNGEYQDTPKSYLVNPTEFTSESRLDQFTDLAVEQFPALYGAWLCWPPMTIQESSFTDCMRFLPDSGYSKNEDYGFKQGPINVMTYLTSRNSTISNSTEMNDNELMIGDRTPSVFEQFTVDLMGAWSGISVTGRALASTCAALMW
jgi:hypothetical protein